MDAKSEEFDSGLKEDIDFIMDCFSGGDTIAFIAYMRMMKELHQREGNGDELARDLVKLTRHLARFIRITKRHYQEGQ